MSVGYRLTQTGEEVQEILDDVQEKTIYEDATQQEHGLMSTSDKIKLDEMESDQALTFEEIEAILNS